MAPASVALAPRSLMCNPSSRPQDASQLAGTDAVPGARPRGGIPRPAAEHASSDPDEQVKKLKKRLDKVTSGIAAAAAKVPVLPYGDLAAGLNLVEAHTRVYALCDTLGLDNPGNLMTTLSLAARGG